jgi:hypothetical protein
MINVRNNLLSARLSMQLQQILVHPHYDVVFERPFDYLVKKIR